MNISKVRGTVEEQRGADSARIKVVSFKRTGDVITSLSEIKNQFPPFGYVFSPHFFSEFPFKINSFIEFSTIPASYKIEDGDEYLLDNRKDCKATGFPIVAIADGLFSNPSAINQPILKNYILDVFSHFYIKNGEHLYGPFKNANGEIIPRTGMEVNKYDYGTPTCYNSGSKTYILKPPDTVIEKVDCMTSLQLGEWLKAHLKNSLLNFDFNILKKALESQQMSGLDKARMDRALSSVDQLSLAMSDLKILADSSQKFAITYSEALNKIREELKSSLIEPFEEKKTRLQGEMEELMSRIQQAKSEETELLQNLSQANFEYDRITKEKRRLIEDIKIHSLVAGIKSESQKLATYEEQEYIAKKEPYHSLEEYVTLFNKSLPEDESDRINYGQKIIYQFKDRSCFLTDSIDTVLLLARLSCNCKLLIQQVEPDWMKFECLFENGLKQIWKSAHENKSQLHFLILEDLNLASVECYGKPILDLLSRIRLVLPGLKLAWPRNLWIFGIPISVTNEFKFGLPLLKETYKDWGAFPREMPKSISTASDETKFLPMEQLIGHDKIIPETVNEYFFVK